MSGRLTEGFREIIELKWSEFVAMEQDPEQSNFASIIVALVRSCTKGNLRAIQTSLDRIDGKIATEVELEMPKFYTLYPNATKADGDMPSPQEINELPPPSLTGVEAREDEPELVTGSLRAVLDRMLEAPKKQVTIILDTAKSVDEGDMSYGDPLVKSVIIAGMMKLVHDGRIGAVFEILEQIDGKVVDTIKVLGGDIYVKNFATIAPAGAVKNADGIYQISAEDMTKSWVARLEQKKLGR